MALQIGIRIQINLWYLLFLFGLLKKYSDFPAKECNLRLLKIKSKKIQYQISKMYKYIAFLRAINVGGHNVKMDQLKLLFKKMGFSNAETFIASGNVIFESNEKDRLKVENTIEKYLLKSLGYEVATFLRKFRELEQIIKYKAFPADKYGEAAANNIGFIKNALSREQLKILKELETEIDDFNTKGREVYWLCKTRQSQSTFSGNLFEKKLKTKVTFRGIKTLQKLLTKYASDYQ